MCNYKYKKRNHPLENAPCIYPDLYANHSDKFSRATQLPHDIEGYCIYHSKDINWKNEKGFIAWFKELLNALTEIHNINKKGELSCNFSGFYFCKNSIPFTLDDCLSNSTLDFSFYEFATGFSLSNSRLSSIDLEMSHFHETLKLSNVTFINGVFCSKSIFDNGVTISNCLFNGYNFFNNCNFHNKDKTSNCVFSFKDSHIVESINFEKSNFELPVYIDRVKFDREALFDKYIF